MSLYKNIYDESTDTSELDLISNISGNYYDPLAGVIIQVPVAKDPICTQSPYFDSTGKCLIPGNYLMITQVLFEAGGANHVGPNLAGTAYSYFDETKPASRSAGCAMVHFSMGDTVLSHLYRWGTYNSGISVQLTLIKRDTYCNPTNPNAGTQYNFTYGRVNPSSNSQVIYSTNQVTVPAGVYLVQIKMNGDGSTANQETYCYTSQIVDSSKANPVNSSGHSQFMSTGWEGTTWTATLVLNKNYENAYWGLSFTAGVNLASGNVTLTRIA